MFVDGRTFDPLLPMLPGRRLIVVDGPGLGASEPLQRRSTIAEAADAAHDLLTGSQASDLGIEGPVDWVGNAFGGHVGYELARRPGVLRSLAAVSAPTEPVSAALRRQIALSRTAAAGARSDRAGAVGDSRSPADGRVGRRPGPPLGGAGERRDTQPAQPGRWPCAPSSSIGST